MYLIDGKGEMHTNTITLTFVMSLFIVSLGYGQVIGVRGRVVDNDNKPIQGALVELITAEKSETTGQDGSFFIDMTSSHVISANPVSDVISFHNGILSLNVFENRQRLQIEVFDNKGIRINKVIHEEISRGTRNITILPEQLPVKMYFVKLQIGKRTGIFQVLNLKNRTCFLSGRGLYGEPSLSQQSAKVLACIDTLEVSKDDYLTVQLDISSYSTDVHDVILKSDAGLPPVVNGKSAKTTRYWDCCKPHCGWQSNMRLCDINNNDMNGQGAQSGCSGGPAFQCWDYAPMEINSKVSYGWAAFNNSGTQCGDCFQLDFQGALSGKQMVVQIINIGDGGTDAFDLLIPGGGVGALNGCSQQWGNVPLGVQYGGFHSKCGNNRDCIYNMCKDAFGNKADLMRGCEWYLGWFKMTSNPSVTYMKVPCPQEIKNISRIGN